MANANHSQVYNNIKPGGKDHQANKKIFFPYLLRRADPLPRRGHVPPDAGGGRVHGERGDGLGQVRRAQEVGQRLVLREDGNVR